MHFQRSICKKDISAFLLFDKMESGRTIQQLLEVG